MYFRLPPEHPQTSVRPPRCAQLLLPRYRAPPDVLGYGAPPDVLNVTATYMGAVRGRVTFCIHLKTFYFLDIMKIFVGLKTSLVFRDDFVSLQVSLLNTCSVIVLDFWCCYRFRSFSVTNFSTCSFSEL